MKRCGSIFALFLMFFAASCDNGLKFNNPNDKNSDAYRGGDADSERVDDDAERPTGREQGELYGECYPDNTCNEGLECDVLNNICKKDSGDSGDTTPDGDSGDSGDTTPDGDSGDSGDTTPDGDSGDSGDTGDSGDSGDSGDTTPDGDSGDSGDTEPTEEEICAEAGGIYDYFAEEEFEKCYKIVDCAQKPANTEWRGDQSYIEYFDFDDGLWTNFGANYKTEYGDTGEAKVCQYVCASNAVREGGTCKPLCSAVFDGESSQIQVAHNDLLNLASETWTIEAWIKQGEDDIPVYVIHPIVRKGITSDPAYVLSGYYKQQSGDGYGMTSYVKYSYREWNSTKTDNNRLDPSVTFSDDWTHVAMVKNKETSGAIFEQTSYKLLLFVNGTLVGSKDFENTPTIVTNDEVLTIGANLANDGRYFKGLIDSIKISNTAKYTADFTPVKLSAGGDDTIAFWDFSGNADDSSGNGLDGSATNVTYSTDCKPLPECSTSNTGPCYDSTSHLTWSKKADTTYNWSGAGTYCNNLTEGGYTDWRLPTISELRTLIKNCSRNIMPGGTCGVRDDDEVVCLSEDCWTSETCASCSPDSTGGYSKFGETDWFWSSSTRSDSSSNAWNVGFNGGSVNSNYKNNDNYVRCVR